MWICALLFFTLTLLLFEPLHFPTGINKAPSYLMYIFDLFIPCFPKAPERVGNPTRIYCVFIDSKLCKYSPVTRYPTNSRLGPLANRRASLYTQGQTQIHTYTSVSGEPEEDLTRHLNIEAMILKTLGHSCWLNVPPEVLGHVSYVRVWTVFEIHSNKHAKIWEKPSFRISN